MLTERRRVVSGGMAHSRISEFELVLPWAGGSHGEFDASHAEAGHGAELKQLETDRATGCRGELASPMRRLPQSSPEANGANHK